MLPLLLLLGGAGGAGGARPADIPQDSSYVLRQNVSCPDSGFFLQRDLEKFPPPGECHLCFCKSNASAVCWRRMNRGCNLESYQDLGTSISRARRSPLNFGNVFVKDATRKLFVCVALSQCPLVTTWSCVVETYIETLGTPLYDCTLPSAVFTKQSAEQCKPFESSFSDGCPPVDWCVGCTVCDCDANGHWDCHILSFCSDKSGQKQMKKRRERPQKRVVKRQSKKSTTNAPRPKKNIRKSSKPPIRKQPGKPIIKKKQPSENNKHKINQVKSSKVHKYVPVKRSLPNDVKAKKAISNRNKVTSRPMVKKRAATNKPLSINSNKHKTIKNSTIDVAQSVVKQYVTTMQKMTKSIERPTNSTSKQVNKFIHKLPKQQNKKLTNKTDKKRKFTANPRSKGNNNNKFNDRNIPEPHNIHKYGRMKRQIVFTERSPGIFNSNNSSNGSTITRSYAETLGKENRTQNPILHLEHPFNNEKFDVTQLKNVTNPDIYKKPTRVNEENQSAIVKDGPFHHDFNNTQSTTTTKNYNSQQNTYKLINNDSFTTVPYNELTNSKQFMIDTTEMIRIRENKNENSDNKLLQLRKQFSDIPTHTDHHNCIFKTLLQKLIGIESNPHNYTEKIFEFSKRPKKYTILNKFKRLFRKVFNKNKKIKLNHKDNLNYRDNDTEPKTVYKEFHHCKLNSNQKEKLRKNLNELKIESGNILSSVRIIKGLLYLLGMNTNDTKNYVSNKPYYLNENMNTLKAIVKNREKEAGQKLTEVQQIQINYIKSNVEVFIKSLWRFANILDDVAQTAMYHNKGHNRFNSSRIINNGYHSNKNFIIRKSKKELEKLKNLIINYKLLQNKFINDIYIILNNIKNKDPNNENLGHNNMPAKNFMKLNNTDAVEINSVNIIKNIRKLKLLTEKLSNVRKRQKRGTAEDDDALEYILILMEYLLKRNAPAYPPANDGIDLLIEAINNAPDLKLIRKKVLDNETHKALVTRTTTLKNYSDNDKDYSFVTTEREEKIVSFNEKKSTIKTGEQSQDVYDDDKIEEIYRAFKYNNGQNSGRTQDKLLSTHDVIPATIESYYNIKDETTTPQTYKGDKNELTFSNIESIEIETTSTTSSTVSTNAMNFEEINIKGDSLPVDVQDNADRFEKIKNVKQSRTVETENTTPSALAATRTHKHKDNPGDVTNDNEIYNAKIADNTSAEEVVSRKQIDLLNSLDYVRENDVEDEIDSKSDKFTNDFE